LTSDFEDSDLGAILVDLSLVGANCFPG
jgi:hypothetical protein